MMRLTRRLTQRLAGLWSAAIGAGFDANATTPLGQ